MSNYTQEEINILREGGAKLCGILNELEKEIQPNVGVHDLEMKARELIAGAGAISGTIGYKAQGSKTAFTSAVCVSVNEEVAHGIPYKSKKVLKEGDVVSLDMMIKYKGLFTDICRTYAVGELDSDEKRLLKAAKATTKAAIAAAVVGASTDDIGHAAEKTAKFHGCTTVRELGGHGVGRKIHMGPFIPNFAGSGYDTTIEEGMVLAIEPIVTLGNWRIKMAKDGWMFYTADMQKSAQEEETVLITKDGPEILTKTEE